MCTASPRCLSLELAPLRSYIMYRAELYPTLNSKRSHVCADCERNARAVRDIQRPLLSWADSDNSTSVTRMTSQYVHLVSFSQFSSLHIVCLADGAISAAGNPKQQSLCTNTVSHLHSRSGDSGALVSHGLFSSFSSTGTSSCLAMCLSW